MENEQGPTTGGDLDFAPSSETPGGYLQLLASLPLFFAPFCGYSVLGSAAADGTSAFNHFEKLSFTDSGANSAMRLV